MGWVGEKIVTNSFGVTEHYEGIDFTAGSHLVRLRDNKGRSPFDKFFGGIIKLGAKVQHAPLEFVVLLIVYVDIWVLGRCASGTGL